MKKFTSIPANTRPGFGFCFAPFLEILSQGNPKLSAHAPGTGSSPAPSTCTGKLKPWRQKSFGWCSLGGGCDSHGNGHSAGISRGKEGGFWCRLCPDVQLQRGEHLAAHSTVCTFISCAGWILWGFSLGKQLLCYSWTIISSLWKSPGTSASIFGIQLLAPLLKQCFLKYIYTVTHGKCKMQ